MFKSLLRGLGLGLLALAFVATSVDAQGIGVRRSQSAGKGWIGISTSIRASIEDGRETVFAIIAATIDGSPADIAGLMAGDTIYRVDGHRLTLRGWDRLTSRLTPGDAIHFSVLREGHRLVVMVPVGLRPASAPARRRSSDGSAAYSYGWEAVQKSITNRIAAVRDRYENEAVFRIRVNGDSTSVTQVSITESIERIGRAVSEGVDWAGSGFAFVADSSGFRFTFGSESDQRLEASERVLVLSTPRTASAFKMIESAAALPFEFYVLTTPEAQSVKTVLVDVQVKLAQNEAAQRRRQDALAVLRVRQAREVEIAGRSVARDDELVHLRIEGVRLASEITRLAVRLRKIGNDEREGQGIAVPNPAPVAVLPAPLAPRSSTFSARLVGRNFVAGAQLANLNAGLAEYFGVRDGVLVMDVLRGSLAAQANLTPGDVIIRVDRRDVGSMDDLRAALAASGRRGETTITVVRNGDRVRLTLPR
ncbi:MAG: PDZ domain-containing protein [Gemmatimonadetes bacterium]|nr:PDZ domain-containing protein [Gemmatimonadota bacterium]